MKQHGGSDDAKRRAGQRAVEAVTDGMVVGLGTGSTAAYAIEAIGEAVDDGVAIEGVPTSYDSRRLAIDRDIGLRELDEGTVDIAIDGADQVANGQLIKGGGGAHAREKLVATAADRFFVVVDETKLSGTLDRPVPLEVLPDAVSLVSERIREMGGEPMLRTGSGKDGPVVTDNGNVLLDAAFGPIDDPDSLATALSQVPGTVEHGLFVDMADVVFVGTDTGVRKHQY